MPLDPSIYSQVGRVNLGQGISDILNQQRQREAKAEQRQLTLASLAQQQQAAQQAQSQKRNQELNMWLSSAVQSGRPIEQVLPEAIAKGREINVPDEVTQRHVTSVYGAGTTPEIRSASAAGAAYPEKFATAQIERAYPKKPSDLQLEAVIGPDGKPTLVPREKAVGMQPYRAVASDDLARQRLDLARQEFEFKKTGGGPAIRKPMTADQEAKYRQKFGEAYGTTINALQSAENVTALANELKTHKGLSGITGYSGYAPDIPGRDAAAARQKFETLQGKITKMAKDAAASSGSIGPMAVQEWKILRDQITAIDPTKLSEKQMQNVMDDLIEQASKAAQITEEAYTSTFSPDFEAYPQFANPRGAMPKTITPKSQTPMAGAFDADKEARYQAWKAQQGR